MLEPGTFLSCPRCAPVFVVAQADSAVMANAAIAAAKKRENVKIRIDLSWSARIDAAVN